MITNEWEKLRLEISECPMCCSRSMEKVFPVQDIWSGENFQISRCNDCSGMFLSDPPSPSLISGYYENKYGELMHKQPNIVFRSLQRVALGKDVAPLLSKIEKGSSLLDLGAGSGALCSYLKSSGYYVEARDFYPTEEWPYRDIPYRKADLNGGALGIADVLCDGVPPAGVILRHVLEHLFSPDKVFETLNAAGVKWILVIVPNTDSPWSRILGKNWAYWDPPRHVTFFNKTSLMTLAARCGYEYRFSRTYGIDESVSSLYRWAMARRINQNGFARTALPANVWNYLNPKSPLAALSSAASSWIGNTVLVMLFKKSNSAMSNPDS